MPLLPTRQSTFMGSNATDLALPSSKVTAGVTITLTVNALPKRCQASGCQTEKAEQKALGIWNPTEWDTYDAAEKSEHVAQFNAGEPGFAISACDFLAERKGYGRRPSRLGRACLTHASCMVSDCHCHHGERVLTVEDLRVTLSVPAGSQSSLTRPIASATHHSFIDSGGQNPNTVAIYPQAGQPVGRKSACVNINSVFARIRRLDRGMPVDDHMA